MSNAVNGIRCRFKVSADGTPGSFSKATEQRAATMNFAKVRVEVTNPDTSVDPGNPNIAFVERRTVAVDANGTIDMNFINDDATQRLIRQAGLSEVPLYFQFFMIEEVGAEIWEGQFDVEFDLSGDPTNVGMMRCRLQAAGFVTVDTQA